MPLAAASCARCTQLETSSLALSVTCMPCCGPAHGMASEVIDTDIHLPSPSGCPPEVRISVELQHCLTNSLSCLHACITNASSIALPSCRNGGGRVRVMAVADPLLDPCWGLLLVSEVHSRVLSDRRMHS